jgi:hypothetical protein
VIADNGKGEQVAKLSLQLLVGGMPVAGARDSSTSCDSRHSRLLGATVTASTHVARPHMGQRAGRWLTTAP